MSSTFPQAILYGYSHLLIQCPLVVLPHYKCEKHLEQKFAPVILTMTLLCDGYSEPSVIWTAASTPRFLAIWISESLDN